MADIPIINTAALAILGNDDLLLRLMRDKASQSQITDYVAWTLHATRALGLKVINAGGANAFKSNVRQFDLDDIVPDYGVSSRQILQTLQRATYALGVPHPVHVHCNNLGVPGSVETVLATMEAAQGLPMHLAHVQFYAYGKEGTRGFSSAAAQLMERFRRYPNISMDVGQVLFGQTVTISGDVIAQYSRHRDASPNKWVVWDAECEGSGGVVPYRYRQTSFVNGLQWAIGLELFLLAEDPSRVFFTTDHPNGAHLVITGGDLVDPGSGLLGTMDVGIRDGVIAAVDRSLATDAVGATLDAAGKIVTPGLFDLHTHIYWGTTYWGIEPDPVAACTAVTTWLDAGSAGSYSFPGFRRYVVDRSAARVLALLNVSSIGLVAPTYELTNLDHCDLGLPRRIVDANRDVIVGINARIDANTTRGVGLEPMRLARKLADQVCPDDGSHRKRAPAPGRHLHAAAPGRHPA